VASTMANVVRERGSFGVAAVPSVRLIPLRVFRTIRAEVGDSRSVALCFQV
jgi:hypothetical protein